MATVERRGRKARPVLESSSSLDAATLAIERKEDEIQATLSRLRPRKRRRIPAGLSLAVPEAARAVIGSAKPSSHENTDAPELGSARPSSPENAAQSPIGKASVEQAPPVNAHVCLLGDDCKLSFRDLSLLVAHQEGPAHLGIAYFCPLSADHCPRAPCDRALGGVGPPLIGRMALRNHLVRVHRGHSGASGLDLSWAGLTAFRVPLQEVALLMDNLVELDTAHHADAPSRADTSEPSGLHRQLDYGLVAASLLRMGQAPFRDTPAWESHASAPARTCGLGGCTQSFRDGTLLLAHQEGPAHMAIPYYCPLTAEHCPRAPCERALGGSGLPLIGRMALKTHLLRFHAGHTGLSAGLNLSWGGLAAFRHLPLMAVQADDGVALV